MPAEMTQELPLSEQPRLLEFPLKQELKDIIEGSNTQVINIIGGGNVPETLDDLARVIAPSETQQKELTIDQKTLATLLTQIDDIPWHMYDQLVAYNDDKDHEKKLRFIDTYARIQTQYVALRESIKTLVEGQIRGDVKNIVFTVCGASPPDLQIIRAIESLNEEYEASGNDTHLYAAIFLPGDEEEVLNYSVRSGIHPEIWEQLYAKAQKDRHIFIHEPVAAEGFAEELNDDHGRVLFKKVRAVSKERYQHNRAGNVDVNRTISEVAARPPIMGVFAEALATPKQFLGSGIELIARHIWLSLHHGLSIDETFQSIQIIQNGFIYAEPWTKKRMMEIYDMTRNQYDDEDAKGKWPRVQ